MSPEQRALWDNYFYPGTEVLRNKRDIRSEEELRTFEYEATALRAQELRANPIQGEKFDLERMQEIHRRLFQDVYEWAGKTRNVPIYKGNSEFARPEQIKSQAESYTQILEKENNLKGLEKPQFVESLSRHYAYWNAAHPFREGNGRTTREFIGQLAENAGYYLDQEKIDNRKNEWNAAAKSAHKDFEYGQLRQILSEAIRPSRAVAFEQLAENVALAKHPELQGAFDRMHVKQAEIAKAMPDNPRGRDFYEAHQKAEIVRYLDTGRLPTPLAREPQQAKASPAADVNTEAILRAAALVAARDLKSPDDQKRFVDLTRERLAARIEQGGRPPVVDIKESGQRQQNEGYER